MSISEKLSIAVSLSVLVGAAVIGYNVVQRISPQFGGTYSIKGAGGKQSPIIIVGGSITALATGSWQACDGTSTPPQTTCLVSMTMVDTTVLSTDGDVDNFKPAGKVIEEPEAWLGADGVAWKVTVYSRSAKKGIQICPVPSQTSQPSACDKSGSKTYLQVNILDSGATFNNDSDTAGDASMYRYFDSGSVNTFNYDRLDRITISGIDTSGNVYDYKCTNGRCNINIGK